MNPNVRITPATNATPGISQSKSTPYLIRDHFEIAAPRTKAIIRRDHFPSMEREAAAAAAAFFSHERARFLSSSMDIGIADISLFIFSTWGITSYSFFI